MATNLLPQLSSLSDLQRSMNAPNVLDRQAERYQGIADSFKEGQLTPLTAIAKGITGAVARGKSEKAQMQRDDAQSRLNDLAQRKAAFEEHKMDIYDRIAAEQEAQMTGNQLAQATDQAAAGDDTGLRNWFASNPQSAKVLSKDLGVPVESMTFTNMNGVDVLIPYGRDAQGNLVTGSARPVDDILKAYAPDAYAARYKTRQENALSAQEIKLKEAQVSSEKAKGGYYEAQANAKENPQPKPLAPQVAKLQNEALEAIGTLSQTNQNISGIVADIDSGNLHTDLLNRAASSVANATGNSTPQSRSLANYTANLKKMVNDSLLLAKGVQTEGDAQRAADAILAAPYDTAAVRERLIELQQINQRSADLKKVGNDQLRAEYGHEPLDYSKFETAGASTGGGLESNAQAQQIRAAFKAGQISRDEAKKQLQALGQ
ncbi:hypothetical protein AMC83_CH01949 [Rhizobium phaseoli]|uniref:hypothetical protein n=1 Tax=Rhizobium phaseoli TaxID=396 RepID=UPI0007EA0389|nr:hypothetical protein [Rhizobium phaseoli]ANL71932.1 hypothetical protein AMC83_CH01949 [Rhizobium phaseoli]